VNLFRT